MNSERSDCPLVVVCSTGHKPLPCHVSRWVRPPTEKSKYTSNTFWPFVPLQLLHTGVCTLQALVPNDITSTWEQLSRVWYQGFILCSGRSGSTSSIVLLHAVRIVLSVILKYAHVFCFTEPDYELLCSGALCRTRLFAADNLLPAD